MNEEIIKDSGIILDSVTCVYAQPPDCTEDQDGDFQKITISTRDNGIDNFINIKTDNWSISDAEEFAELLKHFTSIYEK